MCQFLSFDTPSIFIIKDVLLVRCSVNNANLQTDICWAYPVSILVVDSTPVLSVRIPVHHGLSVHSQALVW